MTTEILTTLTTALVFCITPLLAKIFADFLKKRLNSEERYKIKVGHHQRSFEFEVTKDSTPEDIDKIVRYLTDIQEIEQASPPPIRSSPETDKIEQAPSARPVDVNEM